MDITTMFIKKISTGFIDFDEHISMNAYAIGCSHGCPGCHAESLQEFTTDQSFFIDDNHFINELDNRNFAIDSVVWLGGDVMYQIDRYLDLATIVNSRDLKNVLFTGFLFEDLSEKVKEMTYIIIDGKWNGYPISDVRTNQRIFRKSKNGIYISIPFKELKNS